MKSYADSSIICSIFKICKDMSNRKFLIRGTATELERDTPNSEPEKEYVNN